VVALTAATRRGMAGAALAVACAAVAAARGNGSPANGANTPFGPVVVASRPPAPTAPVPPVRRADALRVARRFGRTYAAWDAGDRSRGTARRLALVATPAVLGALDAAPRPTARPAMPLSLDVIAGARAAGGGYWVALGARGIRGSHVATVLVLPTANGPRVAAVHR
jgi:hypothetical protein